MLESCYRDLVLLGIRGLRRSPIFCITAILTLASGIGANTAVFTLLYGLLLRSLPVNDPQQLARIGVTDTTNPRPLAAIPYAMVQELRRTDHSFADISAWAQTSVTMQDADDTLRLYMTGLISGNGFALLGLRPSAGRLIEPSDDIRGGPAEGWPVVLSYGFWQDRFGGDGSVIGKAIQMSNTPATIVGVAPRDFHGVWQGVEPKLYLPLHYLTVLAGRDILNTPGSSAFCAVIGRLRPGVSIARPTRNSRSGQRACLTRLFRRRFGANHVFASEIDGGVRPQRGFQNDVREHLLDASLPDARAGRRGAASLLCERERSDAF